MVINILQYGHFFKQRLEVKITKTHWLLSYPMWKRVTVKQTQQAQPLPGRK